jgi:hypothetical protein
LETVADRCGQERFVTSTERESLAIAQHELVVAVKHRAQLDDESNSYDVGSMYSKKLGGIELRDAAREGVAHEVRFLARVDFDVIAGGGNPLNGVDREKKGSRYACGGTITPIRKKSGTSSRTERCPRKPRPFWRSRR